MLHGDGKTKHVLVVDDHAPTARLLAELVADAGPFVTAVAGSGAEAERALAGRDFDAVLLDVELGDTSGLAVLERLRARRSPLVLPVIMVTAHDSGHDVAVALRAGANDYVAKPVDLEVLLARLTTHLHLAELAAVKDDALQMASHDLKNPLTAVLGNAHLILDTPLGRPVDDELHGFARAIVRRSSYMQRLIADFLDAQAARDGQLRLERGPVDLRELARQVAAEQADYAAARGLSVQVAGDPVVAPADRARLEQVLHNLVGNALRYAGQGGRVELVTARHGERAVIEVRDDGPGLGDDPGRLFRAYARGPQRAPAGERSTGLGLSIARVLVEAHGGAIAAANRAEGHGAVFRVELPVSVPAT